MTSQEHTALTALADAGFRFAMELSAAGICVDEGENATDWEGLHPVMNRPAEDRLALVEYGRDAALWLAANPPNSAQEPLRSMAKRMSASSSPAVLRALADAMAPRVNIPGVVETRPAPSRETSAMEFMAAYRVGVAEIRRLEGLAKEQAESEFFWRYAERQTGILRCPEKSENVGQARLRKARNAAYHRAYRNS